MIQLLSINGERVLGQGEIDLIYNENNWSIYYDKTYELKRSGISQIEVDVDITILSVALEYAEKKYYIVQEISFDFYSFIYNEIKTDVLINNLDVDDVILDNEDSEYIDQYILNIKEELKNELFKN